MMTCSFGASLLDLALEALGVDHEHPDGAIAMWSVLEEESVNLDPTAIADGLARARPGWA
jgi:hypothetical protein